MDVRLPDGTVIKNVPDGMSKADLTAKLKANGYDIGKLEAPAALSSEAPARGSAGMLDILSVPLDCRPLTVNVFWFKSNLKESAAKIN
jgi:hypothetical protein